MPDPVSVTSSSTSTNQSVWGVSNETVKKIPGNYNPEVNTKDLTKTKENIKIQINTPDNKYDPKNKDQVKAFEVMNYWANRILHTKEANDEEVNSWIANYNWSKLYFDLVTKPLTADFKLRNIAKQNGIEENALDSYLANMKSISAAVFVVVSRGIGSETFWAEMNKQDYSGKENEEVLSNKVEKSLYNIGGNELVSEWKHALVTITNTMLTEMNKKQDETPDLLMAMITSELWRMLDETQKKFGAYAREQALIIANKERDKTGFFT